MDVAENKNGKLVSLMFVFVSGGVRSGKSTWAENFITALAGGGPLVYLATARVYDAEMEERVRRHREARRNRGFAMTVERSAALHEIAGQLPADGSVLLECLGTWTANEMFPADGPAVEENSVWANVSADAELLRRRVANLVVVSNDLFSDGLSCSASVESYRRVLGALHVRLVSAADLAVECVCGQALVHKNTAGLRVEP